MNRLIKFTKNEITKNVQDGIKNATNIAEKTMGNIQEEAVNTIENVTKPILEPSSDEVPLSAPSAPQAPTKASSPPVSQSTDNNNNNNNNNNINTSSSPSNSLSTASTSKDIAGDLKHSIFSEEEINILKLMQINHLKPDIGEDVVNGDILGVLTTALNNQLSTESAKKTMQTMIAEKIPKIIEKIGNFDNNTLAELIFKKTMSSINFRKYLTETLNQAKSQDTVVTPNELVYILIERINSSFVDKPVVQNQMGMGIGNAYPFKKGSNAKTRRPQRRVSII
jgi:hypothetical protein